MANKGGIVTRKDMFSDDAMNFGNEYAKQLNIAIDSNKILVDSVKELNKQVQNFKVANNQKDYITAKQAEALATQEAVSAIKIQEAAEISANKIRVSTIAALEAERKAKQASTDAENKNQKAKEGSVKLTIEERVQNEINNKILKQEALERLGLVSAYTKLNKSRTDAKNTLRDLIASETASTAEIKKAQKEFDVLDTKVRKADLAVSDFTKDVGKYPFRSITSGIQNLIGAFGVTGGIAAFAGIMKGAYETTKKFEQGIADLSAITGASGKDLEFLKNSAIDLGKSTKGGAIAVVEAYKLIASAKPELLENVQALNQVTEATITLSKAAGIELPEAASALTDAMNQFGVDASQAGVFIDALANGAKFGSAEIPQVTEALLKFGAVARSSNVNIKESVALVELLAENGLKGADAGTALRNVLLKISAPDALPKSARIEMERLGISFEMLKDKTIPIADKLEKLKPLLKDNASIVKVFGLENATAAINVLSHTDRLKELTVKMGEIGTAEEQADIRMNTLNGKTEQLSSTYDSLVLSIGKGSGVITNFFKFFVDGAKNALEGLIRLNSSWDELFTKAESEGIKAGAKTFNKQFNFLGGGKAELTEEDRKKIREKIALIQEEIANGNKDPKLITEKNRLLDFFSTGSDNEIAQSIKNKAREQYKVLENEYNINEKRLNELKNQGLLNGVLGKGYDREKQYKEEKERLKKALAEQTSIIREAGKKQASLKDPKLPTDITDTKAGKPVDDKAAKKAAKEKLEAEKQLANSLYELQKQRLEQTIQFNNEISSDDLQTDEMRIKSALDSQKKQFELLELTKNHLLDNDTLTANDRIRIEEDFSAKKIDVSKKTALEIDKINEFDPKEYEAELKRGSDMIVIATENVISAETDRYNKLKALGFANDKEKEDAAEKHEKKLFEIKKSGLIAQTKLQINALTDTLNDYEAQSDGSQKSQDYILAKRAEVAKLSNKLTETEGEIFKNNEADKSKTSAERLAEWYKDNEKTINDIVDISQKSLDLLSQISNNYSEAKIAKIDEEIAKSDEFYSRELEKAGNDQRKKDLIQKEQEKKRAELEKKKRAEQHKQAVFEKSVTIAQIAIQTALAVIKAAPNYVNMAFAAVVGALSLATAIATPIPKYKDGRKGGKKEVAIINDGISNGQYVQEVIERKHGGIEVPTGKNKIVQLYDGDTVHKSVGDYNNIQRSAMMASLNMEGRKMSDYQATQHFEKSYGKELLEELKKNTNAIEKNKPSRPTETKIDINHHLWKMGNTNWN